MASEIWVSHSSISDYQKCARAYYLKNVYRDPKTRNKISLMTPALALGQSVHQVLEGLASIRVEDRFAVALETRLPEAWKGVSGKMGGFSNGTQEGEYYERARNMLQRVTNNPGPLARLAVRISAPSNLPRYLVSEEEKLILCGKIDWLEYVPEDDSVKILDFKSGAHDEREDSLQLPIYALLVHNLQRRKVSGACYWYLDREDTPKVMPLPDVIQAQKDVLCLARDIKWARENAYTVCRKEAGCFACRDYQAIIDGEAEFVGTGNYGQDVYVLRE